MVKDEYARRQVRDLTKRLGLIEGALVGVVEVLRAERPRLSSAATARLQAIFDMTEELGG